MSNLSATVAAVPAAILHPVKTAKLHPIVVIATFVVLAVLAVVYIEARRPGQIRSYVVRIPGVGPRIVGASTLRSVG
jgi:hypothetical protein